MTKNQKIWVGAMVALAFILVGWQFYQRHETSTDTIRIGAVLPLTGIAAIPGTNEQKGIELAVREINASGGILGKKLEIVLTDDQTDAKTTVTAINKEISVDGVQVIIGGTWDFLANAATPVIDKAHKVLITPSALPDTLTATSSYLFTTHSPVAINESVFEKFLDQSNNKRAVIVTINNPWGQAHSDTFKKAISATHSTLLKEVIMPNFDNNDIQRELSLIRLLNPDIILTALNFGDYAVLMKKMKELDVTAKILGHSNLADAFLAGNISKDLMNGVTVYRFSAPKKDFVDAFTKTYGTTLGTYSDTAYDAVYVIKQAIENGGGKYDADSIVAGLHKITGYKGASGLIDYSNGNYPSNKMPVLEIFNGGQFVDIK